ncbi:polyhydroxyalkanoate synthesis regulator DNA-binding domain-containing protein [Tsukamurella sp. NPDC003166]|uniref:polyhydroxyalkanoate synthesis regulator DNA-binding domain-containing protein n=1 Tax=Tsukamurella sp. NPDC003166 TaxID=3154444 RepID=UPI00339F4ABC
MSDDEPYLIKRYSNRKLYDSVRRRFTTLDEIASLLDSGVRIVVRDHDIGTDRTDEVLAQLLRRQAQSRPRAAGSGASSLLAELLRAPAGVAQSVVDGLSAQAQGSDGAPAPGPEPDGAEAPVEKSEPKKSKTGGKSKSKSATAKSDAEAGGGDQRDEEIRELREQVSALTEAVTLLLKEKTDRAE